MSGAFVGGFLGLALLYHTFVAAPAELNAKEAGHFVTAAEWCLVAAMVVGAIFALAIDEHIRDRRSRQFAGPAARG
jgi:hypothetical protein